jgi:hypothetical protein
MLSAVKVYSRRPRRQKSAEGFSLENVAHVPQAILMLASV